MMAEYGLFTGHGLFGGLGMLIFWGLIVAVVFGIAKSAIRGGKPSSETAEEQLKKRYANGEVDRETYLIRLVDLKKG
ncbi:SHOCT domain-containing protein [Magnetococcus sp. PR-3]|uniref:SHOCT domain-containing protein n=1 Tax=Magnetococcus sp. PR-3 TaxID=3120355 RepID=UPI002FCE5D04